ncbi:hypothetical protein [Paenibacillus spongiae]|uniref:LysM domain-containing protein n=1 Tax=Paenibacillus spongiae TaxID=2909671 RepID=A0ABY5SGE5_9BACL|nr:hypothetical protein [Paenibacillus spongiae]UVI31333.1 hypothetical protein L1F29_05680 [Paenibacillus spongiae]
MNKYLKTISITAALAAMIPLSAYAATSAATTNAGSDNSIKKTQSTSDIGYRSHSHGKMGGPVSQDVLDLLKIDQDGMNEKLAAGQTLAQIAEAQGVSREQLKQALTAAFDNRQKEEKTQFTSNLDTSIDSAGPFEGKGRHERFGVLDKTDLGGIAKLLGLSDSELADALKSGKSLADLAKEKGVEEQKLIDLVKASIAEQINQALEDGKLTKEQADTQAAAAEEKAKNIVNGQERVHGGGGHRGGFQGKAPSKSAASDSQTAEDGDGADT